MEKSRGWSSNLVGVKEAVLESFIIRVLSLKRSTARTLTVPFRRSLSQFGVGTSVHVGVTKFPTSTPSFLYGSPPGGVLNKV